MAHRIRIHRTGGAEVLEYEEYDAGEPCPGQVRLVQEAAGVNFVDTQFRDGIYEAKLPPTLGVGVVGVMDVVLQRVLARPDSNIQQVITPIGAEIPRRYTR